MVKKMSELAKMAMSEREMNSFAGGLHSYGLQTNQDNCLDDVIVKPGN